MASLPDLPDHLIGRDLSDKYRIRSRIGSGGFGAVYSATNLSLAMEVAIKITRAGRDDARAMAEATSAARLRSPYTVRVFDVGRLDDGTLYIVMEHLRGRSLRDYLADEGPLPVDTAARWMSQACLALHEAHALGLVHRDVKPSNLFVVEGENLEPHLKLLDFGLAKPLSDGAPGDSGDQGKVVGSPPYMSPEQVRRSRVTAQSDIWALGVVLYEALSGRLPFEKGTPSATLVAIAADPPRSLAARCPHLPAPLLGIVTRCLNKNPRERYPSANELKQALGEFVNEGSGPSVPPRLASSEGTSSAAPTTLFSATVEAPIKRRRFARALGWLAGALMLGGGAVFALTLRTPAPKVTSVATRSPSVTARPAQDEAEERAQLLKTRTFDRALASATVLLPRQPASAAPSARPSADARSSKARVVPAPQTSSTPASTDRRPSRLALDPDF